MSEFNLHQEEELGKINNFRLFRRLLHYVKPYSWLMLLSISMLIAITASEVIRPYILQQAIDNHLTNFTETFAAVPDGTAPQNIHWQGLTLVPEKSLTSSDKVLERYQLLQVEGKYFLIQGVSDTEMPREITADGSIKAGDNYFTATALSPRDVDIFRGTDIAGITRLALLYLLAIIIGFVFNYAQTYTLAYTGQKIIYDMRQELFEHLLERPIAFFDRNPAGRLVTRVTNDIEALNEMYTSVFVNLFLDIFLLAGIIIMMLQMNWHLALVSFSIIPLILLSTVIYQRYGRPAFRQVRLKLAEVNAVLAEDLAGIKVIQLFNRQSGKWREFLKINKELLSANLRELQAFALYRPSMDLIYSLSVALLLWYGGGQVIRQNVHFGVLFAFINYVQQFFRPINDLSEKFTILQSAMAASERIFALLDNHENIPEPANPVNIQRIQGRVNFQNVWFAYMEGQWVLKNISFSINPGETVALVGATGAGKSSIINLLTRLYDIQRGSIEIDGYDIRDIPKKTLRRQIGVVLQDVFLFSGNIADNIRLGNEELTDEDIAKASHYVNADSFIKKLPAGYQEEVYERGSTLSTGQRQLLAFARALAYDPSILVLDEATANIDTETELLIQNAMKKLTNDRTTIVIAHRLSTVRNADKIIVLHKGIIREMGTHQELLARKGIYHKLYRLSFAGQE